MSRWVEPKKKNVELSGEFPREPVTVSMAGTYFRSEGFTRKEIGENYVTWYEAVEHPLTNRWQVCEIWERPNVLTGGNPPIIHEVQPIEAMKALTLAKAIEEVATYEHSNKGLGFDIAEGHDEDSIGDEHVKVFAGMNGFVLDIYNNPHVAQDGRPVTKGFFDPKAVRKAQASWTRKPEDKPRISDTDLSHLFRTSVGVDNMDRLLERRIDISKWSKFLDNVDTVLERLVRIQEGKYERTNKNSLVGLMTEQVVAGERHFHQEIRNAKQSLNSCTFIPEQERREISKNIFDLAELTFHVAHAKAIYNNMERSSKPEEHKAEVEEVVKIAGLKAKSLGGSEHDIKRINAIIIDGKGRQRLDELVEELFPKNKSSKNKRIRERHSRGYSSVYYMPAQLFEAIDDAKQMKGELERVLTQEKDKVTRPMAGTKATEQGDDNTPVEP